MIHTPTMNTLYAKNIFLILLITLFIPAYGMMERIKEQTFKFIENYTVYNAGTDAIDTMTTTASNFAVWFIHTTHNKKHNPINYAFYEQITQKQVKSIHNKLVRDEEKIINDLFNDFNVAENHRKDIISNLTQYKQYAKEYMSKEHPEATHDAQFPPSAFDDIWNTTNINVNGVKLTNSLIPHDDGRVAEASGLQLYWEFDSGLFIPGQIIAPPTINLYPRFWNEYTGGYQYPVILHEIGHLASHHQITKIVVCNGIAHFTKTDIETVYANKNYEKLRIKHEEQADILHKNAGGAHAIRSILKHIYCEKNLFLKHYAQLAAIDELHQFPEKLKNHKPIPVQKVPELKAMKFNAPALH